MNRDIESLNTLLAALPSDYDRDLLSIQIVTDMIADGKSFAYICKRRIKAAGADARAVEKAQEREARKLERKVEKGAEKAKAKLAALEAAAAELRASLGV